MYVFSFIACSRFLERRAKERARGRKRRPPRFRPLALSFAILSRSLEQATHSRSQMSRKRETNTAFTLLGKHIKTFWKTVDNRCLRWQENIHITSYYLLVGYRTVQSTRHCDETCKAKLKVTYLGVVSQENKALKSFNTRYSAKGSRQKVRSLLLVKTTVSVKQIIMPIIDICKLIRMLEN